MKTIVKALQKKPAIHKVKAVLQQTRVSHKSMDTCQYHKGHQNIKAVEIEVSKDSSLCTAEMLGEVWKTHLFN